MAGAIAAGVRHEYEAFGCPADPAILLIHGLGAQLTMWPAEAFCRPLSEAGFHVIRYDIRDSGLSQQFDELGDPDILAMLKVRAEGGPLPPPPYEAAQLAADALALLDAIAIERAHLVGFSMGGVIAQHIAFQAPGRVRSLTLMATNSGDPAQPQASPRVAARFMSIPDDFHDKRQIVAKSLGIVEVLQGTRHKIDPGQARQRIEANFDRWHNPAAVHRLTAAIMAEGDRRSRLREITAPTLVIHGEDDEMVPPANASQLAETIAGARLILVPGMGHVLSESVCEEIMDGLVSHLRDAR